MAVARGMVGGRRPPKLAAAKEARLAYEELGYLLEPRRRYPVNLVAGLLLLLVLSAGLVTLDLIELNGLRSVLAALAATAVWLTVAWLGAVAARQRRWTLVAAITGAAFLLGLLLVALHSADSNAAWPAVSGRASSAHSPAPSFSCSPPVPPHSWPI